MSVLGRCPLSVLVNFIVNLMLGNHSGRDCLRKRRDYYKEGDICCDKLMVLQWKLFTLSNKANQYFNCLICKSMRKSNGVQLTWVII